MTLSDRLVNLIASRQATEKDLEGVDPQAVIDIKSNPDIPQFAFKASLAEVVNDEDRVLRFVWTDESIDADGDLVELSGWEPHLGRYKKNSAVLWAHGRNPDIPPIAKTLALKFEHTASPKRALADFQYAPKDAHPFADMIYMLAKGGFVKATSAGFRVLDVHPLNEETRKAKGIGKYGIWTKAQMLIEISNCAIGNNENTLRAELVTMVDKGLCTDQRRREFEKTFPLTEKDWERRLKEACDSFFDFGRMKTSVAAVATVEVLEDPRMKALEGRLAKLEAGHNAQVAELVAATNKSTEALGKFVPALSDLTKRIALMGDAPGGSSKKPDASASDARVSVTPTNAVKDAGDQVAERLKQSLLPK